MIRRGGSDDAVSTLPTNVRDGIDPESHPPKNLGRAGRHRRSVPKRVDKRAKEKLTPPPGRASMPNILSKQLSAKQGETAACLAGNSGSALAVIDGKPTGDMVVFSEVHAIDRKIAGLTIGSNLTGATTKYGPQVQGSEGIYKRVDEQKMKKRFRRETPAQQWLSLLDEYERVSKRMAEFVEDHPETVAGKSQDEAVRRIHAFAEHEQQIQKLKRGRLQKLLAKASGAVVGRYEEKQAFRESVNYLLGLIGTKIVSPYGDEATLGVVKSSPTNAQFKYIVRKGHQGGNSKLPDLQLTQS